MLLIIESRLKNFYLPLSTLKKNFSLFLPLSSGKSEIAHWYKSDILPWKSHEEFVNHLVDNIIIDNGNVSQFYFVWYHPVICIYLTNIKY